MHVIVIGTGSVGKRHLINLAKMGVEHLSSVDPQFERRREAKDAVPHSNAVGLLREIPPQPQIDAAIIAVPTYRHVDQAIYVLNALQVPMLIEKPLSHNLDGLDDLEAVLSAGPRTWAVVGYSLRFHPALRVIRDLLERNAVGTVLSVRAEVGQYLPDWHPTEDYRNWYMSKESQGGGALLDLSHELDYLQWLFGPMGDCSGYVGTVSDLDMDADDLVELVCRFKSKIVGSIHLDLLQRTYHRSCRIIGSEGTITWDDSEGMVNWYTTKDYQWRRTIYQNDRNIQFIDEMRTFLAAVNNPELGTGELCTMAQARRTLDLILTVKNSGNYITE